MSMSEDFPLGMQAAEPLARLRFFHQAGSGCKFSI